MLCSFTCLNMGQFSPIVSGSWLHPFLLEIHGLQILYIFLHYCVDGFLPPLSLFSLSATVMQILDLLD